MIKPAFKINTRKFQKVLNKYANESNKAIRDTYNSRILDILFKAHRYTVPAKKAKISADFKTRGAAIVSHRRQLQGKEPLFGKEMKEKVRQVRAAVRRSTGFVRSGWLPGIRTFIAAKAASGGRGGTVPKSKEQRGSDKGSGSPATKLRKPVASAQNRIPAAAKVGEGPLARAFAESISNMRRILAGDLQKVAGKHWNGKKV